MPTPSPSAPRRVLSRRSSCTSASDAAMRTSSFEPNESGDSAAEALFDASSLARCALPSFDSSLFDIILRSCSSSKSSVSSSVSPRREKAPPSASSSAASGMVPAGTRTK